MRNNRLTLAHAPETATAPAHKPGIRHDLFDVAGSLLRHKRLITVSTFAVGLLACVIILLVPSQFMSRSTLLPSGSVDQLSELRSLAGLGGGSISDENSSELFPTILRSRQVSEAVLKRTYEVETDGKAVIVSLPEYLGTANPDELMNRLSALVQIIRDQRTGLIDLRVTTSRAALSQAINRAYLDELELYVRHKRRSQAGETALYLETQAADKRRELASAEQALQDFKSVNRGWAATSDPEVATIIGRLQRDVDLLNAAYVYLRQELEAARLTAQKDIPVVRILDSPSLPTLRSAPRRTMTVILASAFWCFGICTVLALHAFLRSQQRRRRLESYERFLEQVSLSFPRAARLIQSRLLGNTVTAHPEDVEESVSVR